MNATPGDPWIEALLRRPSVRVKLSFLFLFVHIAVYIALVAGLLIFLFVIITRIG